jgi:hypothetical protein
MPYPVALSWRYVASDVYPFDVHVYADGVKIADYTFSKPASTVTWTINTPSVSPNEFTLPETLVRLPDTRATLWEVEIVGAVPVKRIVLAQSIEEVKSV